MSLIDWVDRFAVWRGFHPDLQTLVIYGVGIAVYTMIVFAFYQPLSAREPYHTRARPGWKGRVIHALEDVFVFPLMGFAYFALLALSLFLLSKSQSTAQILLLSMGVVVGVRVTAHVHPFASVDLAKLLPWSLFAIILVDPGYLSFSATFARIAEAAYMAPVLAQYFVLFILIEAGLRGLRAFLPGLSKLGRRIEHRRTLSKRAMLRDVEGEHGHHLFRRSHHEHAPRDRSHDFMTLDESTGGKPGTRQGVGPAIRHEMRSTPAAHAPRSAPKAGPGGSGGKLGSW